jgi:hypothetical protein
MTERRTTPTLDTFSYPEQAWSTMNLAGFSVEATDGGIGKVDETTHEVGSGFLIVDTGPWIFGKKVMIPAGAIARVDEMDRRLWVNLTKDDIQNSPEFDETRYNDLAYRDELGTYYGTRIGRTEPMNRGTGPDFGSDDRGF